MVRFIISLVSVGTLAMLAMSSVMAATPTPQPSQTATVVASPTPGFSPTPMAFDLQVTYDETAVRWHAAPGAASYKLTGKVTAVETAADGPCAQSAGNQVINIPLDATLAAGDVSFPLGLPALPTGEYWTLSIELIDLRAFDAAGTQIAGVRIQQIVEGCAHPSGVPTATPRSIGLPSTGSGRSAHGPGLPFTAVSLAVIGSVLLVGAHSRLRRRVRS